MSSASTAYSVIHPPISSATSPMKDMDPSAASVTASVRITPRSPTQEWRSLAISSNSPSLKCPPHVAASLIASVINLSASSCRSTTKSLVFPCASCYQSKASDAISVTKSAVASTKATAYQAAHLWRPRSWAVLAIDTAAFIILPTRDVVLSEALLTKLLSKLEICSEFPASVMRLCKVSP